MPYTNNQNPAGLDVLTSLDSGDLVVVGDISDSNRVKAITNANLISALAPLASPTFTGTPSLPTGTTAVTQSANDNSTKVATTAYVATAAAAVTSEWAYVSKITWTAETATKTFSTLAAHDEYKLVIKVHNNASTGRIDPYFTLNAITTGYYNNRFAGTTITNFNNQANYKFVSMVGDDNLQILAEIYISGKHYSGNKAIRSSIGLQAGSATHSIDLFGGLTGNSADVSSIEITSQASMTGTVELWYKDSK